MGELVKIMALSGGGSGGRRLSGEYSSGAVGDEPIVGVDAAADVVFEFFDPAAEFGAVFVGEVAFDEIFEEACCAVVGEFGFFGAAEAFLGVWVNESAEESDECFAELEFFEGEEAWEAVEDIEFGLDLVVEVESGEGPEAGEHFDEHVTEAGEVGLRSGALSGEDFGGGVFESAGLSDWRASDPEGGADVDDFDLTGAFDHDVGGFEVAVDESAAVEGGDAFEAFAEDGDGHAGFEPAVDFAAGDYAFVDAGPATFGDGILDDFEAVAAEDMEEVEAVDPFHFEHVDALIELEGVHVDKVVDLDAGHECGDLSHAKHFDVIVLGGIEGRW
jgi:hypothetical protein